MRGLEREVSKVCRKVVKALETWASARAKVVVNAERTSTNTSACVQVPSVWPRKENQIGQDRPGVDRSRRRTADRRSRSALPGQGQIMTTGKLGEVMQESIQAALSVVRRRSKSLGIQEDFYQKSDIHIHLPEGATQGRPVRRIARSAPVWCRCSLASRCAATWR